MKFRFTTQAELEAAATLMGDSRFKLVLEAIANYGEQAVREMIYQRDGVPQLQGRAQVTTELLEAFATCREKLNQMRENQE